MAKLSLRAGSEDAPIFLYISYSKAVFPFLHILQLAKQFSVKCSGDKNTEPQK
jgi:hypothetical protein